jgi:hypothetical protein
VASAAGHPTGAAALVAMAVGWIAAFTIIEPSTTHSAFSDRK